MPKKTTTESSIDDIVAENAALHQYLDMQRAIQAGVGREMLQLNEANSSLRRIVAYILMQHDSSYRILYKTLVSGQREISSPNLEVDPITGDWVLSLKSEHGDVTS